MTNGEGVRKHMYFITDHEAEARVGGVSFMDTRMSRPLKNEEGPITVLDEEEAGFGRVGSQVGLGYYDFESQAAYEDNERVADVIAQKLTEIDPRWLRKAGLDPADWGAEEVASDD